MKSAHTRAVLAAAGMALVAQIAAAQAPPAAPPPGAAQPDGSERAELRARLERRVAESKALQERLERALKRMDEGAPTDEVRTMVEPDRSRGGPGGPDRFGRGEGRGRGPGGPPGVAGGPGGPDDGSRPGPKLDTDAILGFLDEHNPEVAQRLRDALKQNQQMGERLIGRIEPQIREVLAERDPETRGLRTAVLRAEWQMMGAVRDYGESLRGGDPAKAEAARAKLAGLLGELFDLRGKLREREVVALEARLADLRQQVAENSSRKDAYITERLEQITRFLTAERRGRGPGEPPGQKPEGKPDHKREPPKR